MARLPDDDLDAKQASRAVTDKSLLHKVSLVLSGAMSMRFGSQL